MSYNGINGPTGSPGFIGTQGVNGPAGVGYKYTYQGNGIEYSEWRPWFAWRPVYTSTNERIWLKKIYRRRCNVDIYPGMSRWHWVYGTEFDILKGIK